MESSIDVAVLHDQIELLYGRKRLATFSFPILGILVAYILSGYSGSGIALAWFLAVCAVTAAGILISELYERESALLDRTHFWAKVGVAGSALNGLTFGAAGILLYPPHSVPHQAFLVLFLGGICACALASSSSYLPAYLFFVVPTVSPVIVRLVLDTDEIHIVMSILTVLFAGFMVALGRIGSRTIKESCILKYEKSALAQELEAFSYSVSHDLRAPLRHLTGFAEMLKEHSSAQLDEKGLGYLNTISNSAKHMSNMIDDLLSFSRIGRSEMKKDTIDMSHLVSEVLNEYRIETEKRNIVWQINQLPNAIGDRSLLKLVVSNLISNALKFTRNCERAEIEIGAIPGNNQDVFFIRDNGVGFDIHYADRLFGVFQRLHSQQEFEGTGIGLANVRRIIKRHGGKTWAEGKVDNGATFYFSLPKNI